MSYYSKFPSLLVGGGVVPWTPADDPASFAWFELGDTDAEAQTQITNVAGATSAWKNRLNLSAPLVQATGAQQPAYTANGIESTIPSLAFDTSNDNLETVGSTYQFSDEFSWALLVAPTDLSATVRILFAIGALQLRRNASGYFSVARDGVGDLSFIPQALTLNQLYLFSGHGKIGGTFQSALNGVLRGTPTAVSPAFTGGAMLAGVASTVTAGAKENCFLAGYKYGDAYRQRLEGYAAWSVNRPDLLPIGHPYKEGPPTL